MLGDEHSYHALTLQVALYDFAEDLNGTHSRLALTDPHRDRQVVFALALRV